MVGFDSRYKLTLGYRKYSVRRSAFHTASRTPFQSNVNMKPLLASAISALLLSTATAQTFNTANVRITFYSFVNNTDNLDGDCTANCNAGGEAGTLQLAMTCPGRSGLAGGIGTQDSPISAPSAGDGLPVEPCGSFYVPYVQKWFIYEDFCTDCQDDPPHFDLFAGGSPDNNLCPNICSCENQLTPGSDTT